MQTLCNDEGKDVIGIDAAKGIRKTARDSYGGLANDVEAVNQYALVM